MRERMERFASFPFSSGCISQSSVDVVDINKPKKSLSIPNPTSSEAPSNVRMKSSKSNIAAGIHKVIKRIKSLSNLFQFYKDDDGDDYKDDDEIEMVIGLPTDVQHVAHIGWDGFNSGHTTMKSWDKGQELLSLPTISLKQFELAMGTQAGA